MKKIKKHLKEKLNKNLLLEQDLGLPNFPIWAINMSTNECTEIEIPDFYLCTESEDNNIEGYNMPTVSGISFFSFLACMGNGQYHDPEIQNTWENFQIFLNGSFEHETMTPGVSFAGLTDPEVGKNGYYLSDKCPSCIYTNAGNIHETSDTLYNTYGISGGADELPTFGGDNYELANGGYDGTLFFILNDSCQVEGCIYPYYDNYFCNIYSQLCQGMDNSQINGTVVQVGAPFHVQIPNPTVCTYEGCLDVYSHSQYICSLYGGALCNQQGGDGIPLEGDLRSYTQNDNVSGTYNILSANG